jgi:hypothetical protein
MTDISVPVFGISWQPPDADRAVIRSVLVFLEERRALFNPFAFEMEREVSKSVLEIRATLVDVAERLPEGAEALMPLSVMRAACREYLDNASGRDGWRRHGVMAHLGRLRTILGYQIARLAVMYGFDIEGELAMILPTEYREDISLSEGAKPAEEEVQPAVEDPESAEEEPEASNDETEPIPEAPDPENDEPQG